MTIPHGVHIPEERIAAFCRAKGIRRLALFGSVLREDFRPESDIDAIVEFCRGVRVGLDFIRIQDDLSRLLGRRVDLQTPQSLSRYFRRQVLDEAEVVYDQAG